MKWAPDAWRIPVASTEGVPAWPLPGLAPKFSATSFGYQRPFTCEDNCERWHCGMDLVDASHDQLVVATEDARIVSVNLGWTAGTRALAATTREHVLIYGGLVPGSWSSHGIAEGANVRRGQPLGNLVGSYGMLHFEIYAADGRTTNSRWYIDDPPPQGIMNPVNYVQIAAGRQPTRETPPQRHEALALLGFYHGPLVTPWDQASKDALMRAQQALGLTADGIWGENTEQAVRRALADVPPRRRSWVPWLAAAGAAAGLIAAWRLTRG